MLKESANRIYLIISTYGGCRIPECKDTTIAIHAYTIGETAMLSLTFLETSYISISKISITLSKKILCQIPGILCQESTANITINLDYGFRNQDYFNK